MYPEKNGASVPAIWCQSSTLEYDEPCSSAIRTDVLSYREKQESMNQFHTMRVRK